jgi:hypothetical protein
VLTSEEELESYFTKQHKNAVAEDEELSWDVPYLNQIEKIRSGKEKESQTAYREAIALPHRVRIRRSKSKDKQGVLIFGKKNGEYTFKLGTSSNAHISLSAEDAIKLFEADMDEKSQRTSESFENIYQHVKKNLFHRKVFVPLEKSRRAALDTLEVLKKHCSNQIEQDYLKDLHYVASELAALPERFLRLIKKSSAQEIDLSIKKLKEKIPQSYLSEIMDKARHIEEGEEILILSEELI